MSILTNKLVEEVLIDGNKVRLDTDYRKVLKYFELISDVRLSNRAKVNTTIKMFYGKLDKKNYKEALEKLANFILLDVYNIKFGIRYDSKDKNNEQQDTKEEEQSPKYLDFQQDANLIYGAFLQAYGIDLLETDMHWHKFVSLLNALPSDTKLSSVIDIRVRKLPKPNKHNAKEIAELKRLKNIHKIIELKDLDSNVAQEELNKAYNYMFEGLKNRVVK